MIPKDPITIAIGLLAWLTAVGAAICVGLVLRGHIDQHGPSATYHKPIKFPDADTQRVDRKQ